MNWIHKKNKKSKPKFVPKKGVTKEVHLAILEDKQIYCPLCNTELTLTDKMFKFPQYALGIELKNPDKTLSICGVCRIIKALEKPSPKLFIMAYRVYPAVFLANLPEDYNIRIRRGGSYRPVSEGGFIPDDLFFDEDISKVNVTSKHFTVPNDGYLVHFERQDHKPARQKYLSKDYKGIRNIERLPWYSSGHSHEYHHEYYVENPRGESPIHAFTMGDQVLTSAVDYGVRVVRPIPLPYVASDPNSDDSLRLIDPDNFITAWNNRARDVNASRNAHQATGINTEQIRALYDYINSDSVRLDRNQRDTTNE